MASRIAVGDLARAVNEAMSEYRDLTEQALKSAVTEVAKETKDIAKEKSPTDMWTERANDGVKYRQLATQEDFDKF